VLDNARYHHALILAPFLREHTAHLKLLFLPPYSPQLAPIGLAFDSTATA
jgi:transposase